MGEGFHGFNVLRGLMRLGFSLIGIFCISLICVREGFADSKECNSDGRYGQFNASLRPQEPKPPYPYREEEASFVNPCDHVTLVGTLTMPDTEGPFPCVVLLHGSAPLDRDEALFTHKPFLVWADYLTRQGIAVLRFDKRGAGKSTGNYNTASIEDFASDALAAVAYLKKRSEIDPKLIGLVGHSEGGMTAALAASQSKDIAYIVLMAGPGVKWEKLMLTQVAALLRAEGQSEGMVSIGENLFKAAFKVIKAQSDPEKAAEELRYVFDDYFNKFTPAQRGSFEATYGSLDGLVNLFNSVWFRYYLTYDPVAVLKQVTIPVLALIGDLDKQVESKENLAVIAEALKVAGNCDYTLIELPMHNHVFQRCLTGSILEYALIEETISPQALKLMAEWIKAQVIPHISLLNDLPNIR